MSTKLVISTFISGAIAGGSFGIVKLTNNNSVSGKTIIKTQKEDIKRELITESSDSKELMEKENVVATEKTSIIQKSLQEEVFEVTDSAPTNTFISKKTDISSHEENTNKVDLKELSKAKETNLEEKIPYEQEVIEVALTKEELQKKFDEEITNQHIILEAVLSQRPGGSTLTPDKKCFLLTEEQRDKVKLPDFGSDGEGEEDEEQLEEDCYKITTTSWAENRKLDIKEGEGFWLRGKNEWVKKMIYKNWESHLKGSVFNKHKNEALQSENCELKEKLNSSFCRITPKNGKDWVEVGCTILINSQIRR